MSDKATLRGIQVDGEQYINLNDLVIVLYELSKVNPSMGKLAEILKNGRLK